MSINKKMVRIVFSCLMMLALAFTAFADTIRLKNGSIIKGRITGFAGGKFTVTIGEGARQRTMTFFADEIDSIEFDAQPAVAAANPPPQNDVRIIPSSTPPRSTTNPRVVTTDTTVEPRANPPVAAPTPRPTQQSSQTLTKPVELTVRVLADNTSNGWTNTGWVVRKGQRIKITGDGEVSLGGGKSTSPAGLYDLEDGDKLMTAVPTGALIAVIGDDNNDFIYVGLEREFVASRDGVLFLGVNEGNLNDNTGAFSVKIAIFPDSGR